jgi:hypothetical protein
MQDAAELAAGSYRRRHAAAARPSYWLIQNVSG